MGIFGRKVPLHLVNLVLQDVRIGLRNDREPVIIVGDEKGPLLEGDLQFLVFQDDPVLVSEDGNENLILELLFHRVPVDIKEVRIDRTGTVFHDIHPPYIVPTCDTHMVRNDIEDLPHPVSPEFQDHFVIFPFCAYLRVQGIVINDIVTVETPLLCLEIGRCIDISDAEGVEIGDDRPCVREPEMAIELQPVCGNRYPCLYIGQYLFTSLVFWSCLFSGYPVERETIRA